MLADEEGRAITPQQGAPYVLPGVTTVDNLRIDDAIRVVPATDDSMFIQMSGLSTGLALADRSGAVERVGFTRVSHSGGAQAAFDDNGRVVFVNPDRDDEAPRSTLRFADYGAFDDVRAEARFAVGAVAFGRDGFALAGSRDDGRIDTVAEDGSARRLLGPPDDPDALVHWDEPIGPVVALLQLDDERIVFVADSDDGERLYVLDDEQVLAIDTNDDNPVDGVASIEPRLSEEASASPTAAPISTPLALAPDGRVLTIGLADDGHPRISTVDVDSGDVDVLADLEGVEPFADQPVSAVAVGDDLIFLAEDRLWKKEGVFG